MLLIYCTDDFIAVGTCYTPVIKTRVINVPSFLIIIPIVDWKLSGEYSTGNNWSHYSRDSHLVDQLQLPAQWHTTNNIPLHRPCTLPLTVQLQDDWLVLRGVYTVLQYLSTRLLIGGFCYVLEVQVISLYYRRCYSTLVHQLSLLLPALVERPPLLLELFNTGSIAQ